MECRGNSRCDAESNTRISNAILFRIHESGEVGFVLQQLHKPDRTLNPSINKRQPFSQPRCCFLFQKPSTLYRYHPIPINSKPHTLKHPTHWRKGRKGAQNTQGFDPKPVFRCGKRRPRLLGEGARGGSRLSATCLRFQCV